MDRTLQSRVKRLETATKTVGATSTFSKFDELLDNISISEHQFVDDIGCNDPYTGGGTVSNYGTSYPSYPYYLELMRPVILNMLNAVANQFSSVDYEHLKLLSAFTGAYGSEVRGRFDDRHGMVDFGKLLIGPSYGLPVGSPFSTLVNQLFNIIKTPFRSLSDGTNMFPCGAGVRNKVARSMNVMRAMLVTFAKFDVKPFNHALFIAMAANAIGYKAAELYIWIYDVNAQNQDSTINGEQLNRGSSVAYVRGLSPDSHGLNRYDIITVHYFEGYFDDSGNDFNDPTVVRCISRSLVEPDSGVKITISHVHDFSQYVVGPNSWSNFGAYTVEPGVILATFHDLAIGNVKLAAHEKRVFTECAATTKQAITEMILLFKLGLDPQFMSDFDYFSYFISYNKGMISCIPAFAKVAYLNSLIVTVKPDFLSSFVRFFSNIFDSVTNAAEWIIDKIGEVLQIGVEVAPLVALI